MSFLLIYINFLSFIVVGAILGGGKQSATCVATRFALIVEIKTLAVVATNFLGRFGS